MVVTGNQRINMPDVNPQFVGTEQLRQREVIRTFCKRPTSNGGVLLITGIRGSGKTRLVDEALNKRNQRRRPGLWQKLCGEITDSSRFSVERKPRGVNRTLIRVDVDPNFPHADKVNKKDEEDSGGIDTDPIALALICNIVFALTSTIDCRYSSRKHGKTLQNKLGFLNFWFDPNALLWKGSKIAIGVFLGLLFCVVWVLLLSTIVDLTSYVISMSQLMLVLLSLVFSALIFVSSWIFLRWRDLRALEKISRKLYMLVNSVKATETLQDSRERKSEWISKMPWIILVLVVIAHFFNLPFDIKNIISDEGNLLPIMGGSVAILSITATWLFIRKEDHQEEYGKENTVWMINLLRRYLYQCHRCGLEPVLVIDELDKLEELDAWWNEKQSGAVPSNANTQQQINRLNQFLLALCRLKASLGAEFIWILIGGPHILKRLHQDRHGRNDGSLGILATTIQQDIVVGPIALDTAKELINLSPVNNNPVDDRFVAILWLRCRGNFSSMIREIEHGWSLDNFGSLDILEMAATSADEAWSPELQSELIGFFSAPSPLWREKIYTNYAQSWIRAGIMNMANRLLTNEVQLNELKNSLMPEDLAGEIEKDNSMPEFRIVYASQPDVLLGLGGRILYSYLNSQGRIKHFNNGRVGLI